jgi:amino acid transporter
MPDPESPETLSSRIRRLFLGAPRDIRDPHTFHTMSLVAFLAWVGLGADGLSSSAYGPDESFKALYNNPDGNFYFLAIFLGLATAITVFVISIAYSHIIERFPFGGGGYVVSTKLLGPAVGVVSGSALLVDYVLTISTSIASGANAIFAFLPREWETHKLLIECVAIGALVVLNLRGVKESVAILTPIFLVFLVTHVVMIAVGIGTRSFEVPEIAHEVTSGIGGALADPKVGLFGLLAAFLKAYSMGAGTYTGIEAVSNGLQIMREPKVETAKRTMLYMSISLAVTAGGILFCYLLLNAKPTPGDPDYPMNAVLLHRLADSWVVGGLEVGKGFIYLTLAAEAALLLVAAQAGFIDGPRVMANMATDSWLPHRFAQLSDRLSMQDGVVLMGLASVATLLYTRGNITALVTMYAINVFVTFSLSQIAMLRYWFRRRIEGKRRTRLFQHGLALLMCLSILTGTVYEKFFQGGWKTLAVTSAVIALCFWIRSHYRQVATSLKRLDEIIGQIKASLPEEPRGGKKPLDPSAHTAVVMVGSYGGLGIHAILSIQRLFPGHFKNFIFVSIGVVDSATMKGVEEVDRVRERTEKALQQYVELAQKLGLATDYRMGVGTEAVAEAVKVCSGVAEQFPRSLFFAGKLVFEKERWFQRLLHNETAYQLQRRLQFAGLNAMVLPVRVMEDTPARAA